MWNESQVNFLIASLFFFFQHNSYNVISGFLLILQVAFWRVTGEGNTHIRKSVENNLFWFSLCANTTCFRRIYLYCTHAFTNNWNINTFFLVYICILFFKSMAGSPSAEVSTFISIQDGQLAQIFIYYAFFLLYFTQHYHFMHCWWPKCSW